MGGMLEIEFKNSKTEHLEFIVEGLTSKTAIYGVYADGVKLALVKWYAQWRRYCLFPEVKTLFDVNCLGEIMDFIKQLMEDRKQHLRSKKGS